MHCCAPAYCISAFSIKAWLLNKSKYCNATILDFLFHKSMRQVSVFDVCEIRIFQTIIILGEDKR